ncbi:transcription termination/antitermination protein NusG [Candidatus Berkelbacteria bacterium]|nr:transcription termination/antitermination protein NusG [Candidatus Berkelbacteria bacterium]
MADETPQLDTVTESTPPAPEAPSHAAPAAPVGDTTSHDAHGGAEPTKIARSVGKQTGDRNWYVIHTYSGYEDQVSENLRQRIESFSMQDRIFDVVVPKEKQIEIKGGKRNVVEKKIYPGYVLVDMIVNDDSWYVVRNTPNVTGFIGLGVRPTPISAEEVATIRGRMAVDEPKYKIELKVDDLVRIVDGPLKNFEGKVMEIDDDKGKVKVLASMFGRETPVSLDFLQVKKV